MLYIMPVKGGNLWSKLAGEYYNEHKNDSDIEKFSDVLKSPKFRAYYESKKNGSSMVVAKKTKGKFSKKKVTKKGKKSRKVWDDEEMNVADEVAEEDAVEEEVKPKKKASKKASKKVLNIDVEDKLLEPEKDDRKNQFKNDYFNGGDKDVNEC